MSIEQILNKIQCVSPQDGKTLDEIDSRVACYLQELEFGSEAANYFVKAFPQYTRSRDALKAIRPTEIQGVRDVCWNISWDDDEGYVAYIQIWNKNGGGMKYVGYSGKNSASQRTEELAELHAIIQAIEYERTNK